MYNQGGVLSSGTGERSLTFPISFASNAYCIAAIGRTGNSTDPRFVMWNATSSPSSSKLGITDKNGTGVATGISWMAVGF